ncbi:MAG: cell wall-binding repeat-containing protein, partial [Candidatus Limnocylindrales bacterium]
MVSAVCPNCHILLLEANDTTYANLGTAVDTAVSLGAIAVSNSYGGPESSGESTYLDPYYNHPGVAITAATGDCGYNCAGVFGGTYSNSVGYPAASPYVVAVGGTSLTPDTSARGWTESAWGDADGGAGSGCSVYESKPSWQQDTGCANRTEADVSAVADPETGVWIYKNGYWYSVGGTSAASPIIASTFALAGAPAAGTYPASYLYGDTANLNDVIGGNNDVTWGGTVYACTVTYLCNGVAGYDGPTGLGTPNGLGAFMAHGPATTLTLSGLPSPTVAGTAHNLTVTARDAYGNTATGYRGTVHFSSTDPAALLPADYTFTAADNGTHTFSVTLKTAGTRSVTATDTVSASISGTKSSIVVSPGVVVAWGWNEYGQTDVPAGLSGVTSIAAGCQHSVALKADGTVVAWGDDTYGQTDVPAGLSGVTSIAAGCWHSVALKADGTVVAWGDDDYGQTSIPYGLSGVTAISAGDYFSLALKSNGTLVPWGLNDYGDLFPPAGLSDVTAISAGADFNLALRSDGTVVGWGRNDLGQSTVPAGLSGVVAISAGSEHSLALKSDGTIVAWGYDCCHQTDVPAGLSDVTAISAGADFNLALRSDGTVVGWGVNSYGETDVPTGLSGVAEIAAGESHSLAVARSIAATFAVSGLPSPTVAGVAHNLTVTARDAYGNTATSYTGTAHFTSTDGSAVLPADYTFTAADNGVHVFSVTLKTAGTRSVTATDTSNSSITGSQSAIVVNPGSATTLALSGLPSPTVAGTAHNLTVTARDAYGNTATGYRGTVHFSSTDAKAGLPADYTFTAADNGVHVFSVTLKTAGTRSVTATDTVTASITGSQTAIVVNPGSATTLVVSGFPSPTVAGVAHNLTVTAKDTYGNTATGYTGTIHFTSSDGAAVLPANGTLTAGTGTFSVTLRTSGTRTVTATDTVNSLITGAQSAIVVIPGAATHLVVSGYPSPTFAGTAHNLTVTARDAYGNTATGYHGTIHFTSSDPAAVLPANYTFNGLDAGIHVFSVTLKTLGSQSVTATDTVSSSITGSQSGIVVKASIVRYSGADRFATAAAVSAHTFGSPCHCTAYLATAYNFPDALAGAAAAGTIKGPVLFVAPSGAIDSYTATELLRLKPDHIVVLGGTGVVSAAVMTALAAYAPAGQTVRYAGADRFATAAAVSLHTFPSNCACTAY